MMFVSDLVPPITGGTHTTYSLFLLLPVMHRFNLDAKLVSCTRYVPDLQ